MLHTAITDRGGIGLGSQMSSFDFDLMGAQHAADRREMQTPTEARQRFQGATAKRSGARY